MSVNSHKWKPTFILIAVNVIVYLYAAVVGGSFLQIDYQIIVVFGQVNGLVLSGAYWQLFTSMFIHVNIAHLLGNMLFLLIFGLRAEKLFSLHEYLLIYLVGGLAGNLLSLFFMPLWVPSAGASGAIFGVFGAATVYVRRRIGQSIIGALAIAFLLLLLSSGPNVNNLAHIGGLVFGLFAGYVLAKKRKSMTEYSITYSY